MFVKLKKVLKDLIEIIQKPVMSILPGQLAFSFVLTIIPVLVLVVMIASSFSVSVNTIYDFIKDSFPEAVSGLLLPLVKGRGFDFSIVIFLLTGFWLASGGANSVITASDIIYGIEPQHFIPKRIKAFVMTFILIMLIMFMFLVPAFGDTIFRFIANLISSNNFSDEMFIIYYLLKYPLSFFLIYFNLKLIYTIAPNKQIKSKTVTTGAMFTTIMWMVITQFYSFWVGNIAHYDIIYGSISNIIILLIWMYFLAYIFVVGLVLNAGIDCEKKEII